MQILMIAINDPAGTAIEFTKAINRHTKNSCRLITKEIRYNFMFEKDLHLPWLDADGWDEVADLLRTSDIFHFHMTADEYIELGPFKPVDYLRGKLVVHHHHGHPDFRGNPEKYRKKYRERGRHNLLVSTPDLLKRLPGAKWQPNLVPIGDPLYLPLAEKPDEPVVVCHSPTRRDLKNTVEFLTAMDGLQHKLDTPVEVRVIENTLHKKCLEVKRQSHILFDHLQGYYGVSSLEGLSQGLCVIAGLDAWNRSHIEKFTRTDDLPWITTTPQQLPSRLEALLRDRDEQRRQGRKARQFMETGWNEKRVVERLLNIYRT